ncbi:hypothetical protein EJ07DRAFT_153597 [Lizonia empirigonia]|nr:hypothetical protein EJ07DRAFT_153597 [Lizonia empirigonia]
MEQSSPAPGKNERTTPVSQVCSEFSPETYHELASNINTARSIYSQNRDDISRNLRGPRLRYDGTTASQQRKKRRRTGEMPPKDTGPFPSIQSIDRSLCSPESIGSHIEYRRGESRADLPDMSEQLPVDLTTIPSPAISEATDLHGEELQSLFITDPDSYRQSTVDHIEAETGSGLENDFGQPTEPQATSEGPLNQEGASPKDGQQESSHLRSKGTSALACQTAPDDVSDHWDFSFERYEEAFEGFIADGLNRSYPDGDFTLNSEAQLSSNQEHQATPGNAHTNECDMHLIAQFKDRLSRRSLWLPHEDRQRPSVVTNDNQILGPLMERELIPPAILHGILYRILPDAFDIIEHTSYNELRDDMSRLISPECDRTVVIITDISPDIVLVDACRRKLICVTSRGISEMSGVLSLPADWTVQIRDPSTVDPSIECTLLSIYLVESECKTVELIPPYVEAHLRKRYFETLLVREEEQWRACNANVPLQAVSFVARLAEADATSSPPIAGDTTEFHINELDPDLLKEALSRKPKTLKDIKCLRILQYIHGTGGPQVLDHLKASAMSLDYHVDLVADNPREAHAARISVIHAALDSRGSTSHFGIAQSRFAKLCYYREFQQAVESLRSSNKARRVERQRLARHQQRLGHVPENDQTVLTPQTNAMAQQYSETTGRSSSVVRDDVVRRLSTIYKRSSPEDQAEIKLQVDSYIRQGKILHLILQGRSCNTSPAVLLLIPTVAVSPLDVTSCVQNEHSKQKLRKRFKPNEIDDLSETEAQWMGDALRILRPEILKEPPDNALKLLENGPSAIEDVSRRDSKQFAKDPFGFFA